GRVGRADRPLRGNARSPGATRVRRCPRPIRDVADATAVASQLLLCLSSRRGNLILHLDYSCQQPQNEFGGFDHSVQAFWFGSKQMRNELNVCVPRGSGGSSPHSRIGLQIQYGAPQVSLHSDGVDQLVQDPNCAGQLLEAWQLLVVTTAARIAS